MVLERQIVMASLSYLVYKAGAVVAKQGKLARSTKTLSNNFDEKLELPKNDPGNSEQQTAAWCVLRLLQGSIDCIVVCNIVVLFDNGSADVQRLCDCHSDPSIFHERTELILSKLLSTHQTVWHSFIHSFIHLFLVAGSVSRQDI